MNVNLAAPLCLGSSGEPVRALQRALNDRRIAPPLSMDGRFGSRTDRNVRAFQKQSGLKPDGVVGARTSKALGWNYTGHAARPYTVRMEAPLPATTPPLFVLADAILHTMGRYQAAITEEVRNSGAPKEWIDNSLDGLSVPCEYLAESLTALKKDTLTPEWMELFLERNLTEYQGMLIQIGLYLKNHGGSTRRIATLIEGFSATQLANTVRRFLEGHASAAITIATIEIQMSAVLGPLLPMPTPQR